MAIYQVTGKNTVLTPLTPANLELFYGLLQPDFLQASLLYDPPLNFSYNCRMLEDRIRETQFDDYNRIYLITESSTGLITGIAGLFSIDWIQKRAEVILIMDRENRKQKKAYEPLKLILRKAIEEWNIGRFYIRIYADDDVSFTVLKSFGFTREGELKEYGRIQREWFDVFILGLKAGEFHYVDY